MENFENQFNHFEEKDIGGEKGGEHKFAGEMEKPKEEWSEDFKAFVDEKIEENKLESQQDEIIKILKRARQKSENEKEWSEEERDAYRKRKEFMEIQEKGEKDIVDMYFDDFEIDRSEVVTKKVMDIGCGSKADFVQHVIEELGHKSVYGLDNNIDEELVEKHPQNLHKGDFHESLPIDNLDLVIARAALVDDELMREEFLENILSSLREEGELRVFPIFKNHFESDSKEALEKENNLIERLNELSKKMNFNHGMKVKDVSVYGSDNYPTAKILLIIKKSQ